MEFLSIRLPPKDTGLDGVGFIFSYDNSPKGAIMSHGDDLYTATYNLMTGTQKLAPRGYYESRVFGELQALIALQAGRMIQNRHFEFDSINYMRDYYVANGWQAVLDVYITPYTTFQPHLDRMERDVKARAGEVVL
jgi:hypothetical protein